MPRLLVADDDEATRREVKFVLEAAGYAVEVAADGNEALKRAAISKFDVIILDVVMPGLGGLEACRVLKSKTGAAMQPVLLMVPKTDAASRARGLSVGADDWVQKPVDAPALLARVASLVRIKRVHDDVRETRSLLGRMNGRDDLTALTTYRSLDGSLKELLAHASRYKEPLGAALFDIDALETINKRFGRGTGDETLKMLAEVIRARLRDSDVAVRYGPDEALVLMPRASLLDAIAVAETIWRDFGTRSRGGSVTKFAATASAGVACYPGRDVRDAEELLRATDAALGHAKRTGANRVCGFQQKGLLYIPSADRDRRRTRAD